MCDGKPNVKLLSGPTSYNCKEQAMTFSLKSQDAATSSTSFLGLQPFARNFNPSVQHMLVTVAVKTGPRHVVAAADMGLSGTLAVQ